MLGSLLISIAGALVVGLSLGVFGSGGSILTVPVLVYLLGHEDKVAIAESLGIVGGIALFGAIPYAREKLIDWRAVLLFGVPGVLGTYLGAVAAGWVSGAVQLLVFAGVMVFAAVMMWRKSSGGGGAEEAREPAPIARLVVDGVFVGALTGFVGVGGGFMIVPALVLLGGLAMRRAVATSLTIIAMKSAVGFLAYLDVLEGAETNAETGVDWLTMGVFIVAGAAGTVAGKTIGGKVNQKALKKGFAGFMVVMAVFILVRESMTLL